MPGQRGVGPCTGPVHCTLLHYIAPQERRQYRACSSPTGHQLFGKQLPGKEMDCACSVKRWELEQVKTI